MKLKNKPKNFKEKYYICPKCGALNTETQTLEEISNGSCGMCYCEFNNERILNKYKKINKRLWEELKKLKSDKLRLKKYKKC
ncbi:MAG: hypothetical protein AABY06_03035 [Nanoarchaeota archaeon]